jgi:ribonuclease P protein component
VQRLKTRAQFEAAMAGGTVSRTPHFVLHRAALPEAPSPLPSPVVPAQAGAQEGADALGSRARGNGGKLFPVQDEPWIGAVVPKRHAKRAVTRNGIKRQIYNVSAAFEPRLPAAAHVVRLRQEFARKDFPSAWSEQLKAAVRGELLQLFEKVAA